MSNRRRSRVATAVALAAAIAVTGCGGSTRATGNATGNSSPAAPPTSTTQAATTATHARPAKSASPTRTQRRFLILGNAVCRTVRIGAPAPVRPNARPAQVSAYAKAALPAAQRTAVSLQRIGTRARHAIAFDHVARDFTLLSSLYLQAAGRTHGAHALLTSIDSAERRAASDARRSGLPACAPGRAPS
jgi:hypothetical protein